MKHLSGWKICAPNPPAPSFEKEHLIKFYEPQAVGFYEHMDFRTYKRTDFDEEGNPYPLLYMKLGHTER